MRRAGLAMGLLALAGWLTAGAATAWADEPVTRAVNAQRVEIMPDGPLCWRLNINNVPPNIRVPETGFLGGPPRFTYIYGGEGQRIEYATG